MNDMSVYIWMLIATIFLVALFLLLRWLANRWEEDQDKDE